MDQVRRVIDAAGRRLFVTDLLARLVITSSAALGALVLVRAAQKLAPFEVPWTIAIGAGAAAAVFAATVWAWAARRRPLEVAQHVDERASLRDTLATALQVAPAGDGWSRNVVESAEASARRVVVRDAVPIRAPRLWGVPAVLALALLSVWWVPRYDLGGLFERRELAEREQRELEEVRLEARENERTLREMLARAGVEMEEGEASDPQDEIDPKAPVSPEDVRRTAVRQLTSLAEQLEQQIEQSESGASTRTIQDAMRELRAPGAGPLSEMARQMAQGNFDRAREELERMGEQMASGELGEEDRQRAAEQLRQLAQQLEQLAEQRQRLEDQLQAAGISKEEAQRLAGDPEALRNQLEQNPSLSQEQREQLQQQAQAQQQASDAMSAAAQAMGQMAQGLQTQSPGAAMDAMDQLSSQLSQMELAQGELQAAEAALCEVQRQLEQMGQGLCDASTGQCFGQGQGQGQRAGAGWQQGGAVGHRAGVGVGSGAGPDQAGVDFTVRREHANVQAGEGPVIASMLVYGSQIRGESRATFSTVASSARAEAAEAIEHSRVPRRHESAVQHYFGRLEAVAGQPQSEPADD